MKDHGDLGSAPVGYLTGGKALESSFEKAPGHVGWIWKFLRGKIDGCRTEVAILPLWISGLRGQHSLVDQGQVVPILVKGSHHDKPRVLWFRSGLERAERQSRPRCGGGGGGCGGGAGGGDGQGGNDATRA